MRSKKQFSSLRRQNIFSKFLGKTYFGLAVLFIYVPIAVMVVLAFNNTGNITNFHDFVFGFKYFQLFFSSTTLITAIFNSLAIGILATAISTLIGTFAAIGLWRMRLKTVNFVLAINNIPLMNTDIVTAVSLLILFLAISMPFGFFSLLAAHISFCVPYVLLTVLTRMRSINPSIVEASYDLGASPFVTLRKVIIPIIRPGIYVGASLAFANSFDDFIISYFNSGDVQNISTFLYTMKTFTPIVNVFFVFLLIGVVISFLVMAIGKEAINRKARFLRRLSKVSQKIAIAQIQNTDEQNPHFQRLTGEKTKIIQRINHSNQRFSFLYTQKFKQRFNVFGVLMLLAACCGFLVWYFIRMAHMLSVAVFGSYISDAAINNFYDFSHINVNQINYSTNEELGAKLLTGQYAVTMPSDYYVKNLFQRNYIQLIDWNRLAKSFNKANGSFYDGATLKNTYIVPSVSAVLNTKVVDEIGQKNIMDYFVPFYWGTIVAVTPTGANTIYSYGDIWAAIESGEKILLNDDQYNTYMFAFQLMCSTEKYIQYRHYLPNGFTLSEIQALTHSYDGINANSTNAVTLATQFMINLEKNHAHFVFQGDEIQDTLALNNYKLAICYTSNVTYAKYINPQAHLAVHEINDSYSSGSSIELFGNNYWFDGFCISSKLTENQLNQAYDFIGFLISEQQNLDLVVNYSHTISAITPTYYATQITNITWDACNHAIANPRFTTYLFTFAVAYANGYNEILAANGG